MTKRKITLIAPRDAGCPITRQKQSRNAPCQCGSGKKQKHCCRAYAHYFSKSKPQAKNEK